MAAYVAGDPAAFAPIHAAVVGAMTRAARAVVDSDADASEAVQSGLLRAHLARARFGASTAADAGAQRQQPAREPEETGDHGDATDHGDVPDHGDAAVVAWYVAFARHAALDLLRARARRHRRQAPTATDVVDLTAAPDEDPEQAELRRELDAQRHADLQLALRGLSPKLRSVVELHKLHGFSLDEVAARLQIAPVTARVRAHRAYRRLHQALGEGYAHGGASVRAK
jgi:RNA polymerase sigma factor (sigma-70 family)